MTEFQVRRVLADADLNTPAGRDEALEKAARLIAEHTSDGSAIRDELVRQVADRLDVRPDWVVRKLSAPPAGAPAAIPSAGEVVNLAEREFLVQCLAGGELGRSYLSEPTDASFAYDITRRARQHLVDHFDDPLAALPEGDPDMARLVNRVMHDALDRSVDEGKLRMSVLQLEKSRIERTITAAKRSGDHADLRELADALQRVRVELDTVMGQTA